MSIYFGTVAIKGVKDAGIVRNKPALSKQALLLSRDLAFRKVHGSKGRLITVEGTLVPSDGDVEQMKEDLTNCMGTKALLNLMAHKASGETDFYAWLKRGTFKRPRGRPGVIFYTLEFEEGE